MPYEIDFSVGFLGSHLLSGQNSGTPRMFLQGLAFRNALSSGVLELTSITLMDELLATNAAPAFSLLQLNSEVAEAAPAAFNTAGSGGLFVRFETGELIAIQGTQSAAVPEPASWALAALGLLHVVRRRGRALAPFTR